jgi:CRP/FNR family cyclic AMP-dependent transcriptional regulator
MSATPAARKNRDFDPGTSLAAIGYGAKTVAVPKKQTIFAQGDVADAVFDIEEGKVRLVVVSKTGNEATTGY